MNRHFNINPERLHLALRGTLTLLSLFALMLAGTYFKSTESLGLSPLSAAAALAQTRVDPENLLAKAAIIYDAKSGDVLFERNADEALPLASLTKLMTAEVLLAAESPDAPVTITAEDLASDGDSGLKAGDIWTLKNLLTFGLVQSSNDAMTAAAASAGMSSTLSAMNAKAQALGLADMRFSNPTGLDESSSTAGAYGSARDVALLAQTFLADHPELFGATVLPGQHIASESGENTPVPTATPILPIPGLIGAKTGYTDLAGGNLVAVFDLEIGHPVIAVVLGSTYDGRFSDMEELIRATRAAQK